MGVRSKDSASGLLGIQVYSADRNILLLFLDLGILAEEEVNDKKCC